MNDLDYKARGLLFLIYTALVLPSFLFPFIGQQTALFSVLFPAHVLTNAFPLLAAKFAQDFFFGGPQGLGMAVCFLATPIQWCPLLVLSVFPRVWNSRRPRVVAIGWIALFLTLTILSAAWLILDPSLLAG